VHFTRGSTRFRTRGRRRRRSGWRCARTYEWSPASSTSPRSSCERRDEILAERRRYEERIRGFFREGRDLGELRTDLDEATAALLVLSAANWAYTWLQSGRDTDELADRFYALLLDGMRGYATPPSVD